MGCVKKNKMNKHYLKLKTKTFPIIYYVYRTTTITVITIITASPITHRMYTWKLLHLPRKWKKNRNNLLFNNFLHFLLSLMWFRVINLRFHCVLRIFFVRQSLKNVFHFRLLLVSSPSPYMAGVVYQAKKKNKRKECMQEQEIERGRDWKSDREREREWAKEMRNVESRKSANEKV